MLVGYGQIISLAWNRILPALMSSYHDEKLAVNALFERKIDTNVIEY